MVQLFIWSCNLSVHFSLLLLSTEDPGAGEQELVQDLLDPKTQPQTWSPRLTFQYSNLVSQLPIAPPVAARNDEKLKLGKSFMKVLTVVEKAMSNLVEVSLLVPSVDFSSMKTVFMWVSTHGRRQPGSILWWPESHKLLLTRVLSSSQNILKFVFKGPGPVDVEGGDGRGVGCWPYRHKGRRIVVSQLGLYIGEVTVLVCLLSVLSARPVRVGLWDSV